MLAPGSVPSFLTCGISSRPAAAASPERAAVSVKMSAAWPAFDSLGHPRDDYGLLMNCGRGRPVEVIHIASRRGGLTATRGDERSAGAVCRLEDDDAPYTWIRLDRRWADSLLSQPRVAYAILNCFLAGLGSGPPGPKARTSNVYLPGLRYRYVFGDLHSLNFAFCCFFTNAH